MRCLKDKPMIWRDQTCVTGIGETAYARADIVYRKTAQALRADDEIKRRYLSV